MKDIAVRIVWFVLWLATAFGGGMLLSHSLDRYVERACGEKAVRP